MKIFIFLLFTSSLLTYANECHFEYSVWSVQERRSVKTVKVSKKYNELTINEISDFGCTPCLEDQKRIQLINGLEFKVCKKIAKKILSALNKVIKSGYKIRSIVGYRPQMSRGKINAQGLRTQLSNHSFGTAIDINERANGLYGNCFEWNPNCRLLKGGIYSSANPLAIKAKDELVTCMLEIGLNWGGEIKGRQKDFMHFSPSGY